MFKFLWWSVFKTGPGTEICLARLLFYCIPWLARHMLLYCSAIHTQGDSELKRYVDTPVFTVRLRLTLLWDKTCCFWDVNQNIITLAVSGLYQRKPRRLTAGETFGCFLWNCEQERVDQCLTCCSNFYLMSAFLESSEFFFSTSFSTSRAANTSWNVLESINVE